MTHVIPGPAKPGRKRVTSRAETIVGSSASTPAPETELGPLPFNGVTIFINGAIKRRACTDTGAEANLVDSEVVRHAGLQSYAITDGSRCQLSNGSELTPISWLDMEFTIGGRPHKTYKERFLVVENAPYDALLGVKFCDQNIYTKDPNIWVHILQRSKASIARSEQMQAERDAMDQEDMDNEQSYLQSSNDRERERLANISSEDSANTITENQSTQGVYTQAQNQIDPQTGDGQSYAESSRAAQSTSEANSWTWDGDQQRWRRYDYELGQWIWN